VWDCGADEFGPSVWEKEKPKKFGRYLILSGPMDRTEISEDPTDRTEILKKSMKLTKLRRLTLKWSFDWPDGLEGISQAEGSYSCVGTLLSSCSLHSLYIVDDAYVHYPMPLDMWRPAAPCILQILQLK